MSHPYKSTPSMSEEELPYQSVMEDPVSVQEAKKEADASFVSSSSCTSCTFSSSSSSVYSQSSITSEDKFRASGTSKSPWSHSSTPSPMVCTPFCQHDRRLQNQSEGQPSNSQTLPGANSCSYCKINVKVIELVRFLLLKYKTKELTTQEEIVYIVLGKYQKYYHVIVYVAFRTMLLTFGIEVKLVEPHLHSYVLIPALSLTYDGMLSDVQGFPKTGLLMMVLCIILKEGNHASEEVVWKLLNYVEVFADRYHVLFGHARKLITEEFVQEGYLEYRQVPHSEPARYQFLWGPRAHAETSKMKFLMFLKNINEPHPKF